MTFCWPLDERWASRALLFAVATFGLIGCSDDAAPSEHAPCENPLLCGAPLLIAHRGGGELRPEETLPAFENAAALGADVLELDVHSSADGEIVCMHDDTVDRTTDGSGPLHALTLSELKQLDAGYRFTTDGGASFPWRGRDVRIPTLGEVLDAHPSAWFSVELKQTTPDIVDPVLAVLEAKGALGRAVLVSFSDDVVLDIREKRPEALTGMGVGEMLALYNLNDETEKSYRPPTRVVQPPKSAVSAELVARANRLSLRLHAWTVNERAEMETLLQLGTHGIMTDDPALLAEVIAER